MLKQAAYTAASSSKVTFFTCLGVSISIPRGYSRGIAIDVRFIMLGCRRGYCGGFMVESTRIAKLAVTPCKMAANALSGAGVVLRLAVPGTNVTQLGFVTWW